MPYRFFALTLAPARISSSAVSRSSAREAQCRAVVPSASDAFTSTRCCTSDRIAALSRFLTASINRTDAAFAFNAKSTKSGRTKRVTATPRVVRCCRRSGPNGRRFFLIGSDGHLPTAPVEHSEGVAHPCLQPRSQASSCDRVHRDCPYRCREDMSCGPVKCRRRQESLLTSQRDRQTAIHDTH